MKDDGAFLIFSPSISHLAADFVLHAPLVLVRVYESVDGSWTPKSTCGDLVFLPLRSFKGNPLGIQHRSYDIADRDP